MPINLQDIRTAVMAYLDTKVDCFISTVRPKVPNVLSPDEPFKFDISARNANAAAGGIRLTNVRYHISVSNPDIAELIIPKREIGVCRSPDFPFAFPPYDPDKPKPSYILYPIDTDYKTLDVGEEDFIGDLAGRAKKLGKCQIYFKILADVDTTYLFPRDETSTLARRDFEVL